MPTIRCKIKLFKIGSYTILHLPENISAKLPSRSQVMVKGTIDGTKFQTALEPDGKWSHWLRVDTLLKNAKAGDTVTLEFEPTKDWPEPKIPTDLKTALAADSKFYDLWMSVTPMARWEWIRWITSTKNPETRQRRLEVSFSKLKNGLRRPCCFNRAMCTNPYVSKNGVLLEPTDVAKK